MRLDEACVPTFARHETFHPRLGWFRKAFLAAWKNSGDFFLAEDAPVRLGVGKNMVRSIRFWGVAAHLITEIPNPERPRVTRTAITNAGNGLLGPDGLDPYMEDVATWWWLHWLMLAPGSQLPVWWVLLNELNVVEFDDELALRVCIDAVEASTFDNPHPSSIEKDISAFLRTYTESPSGRGKFDDQFGCPLRDLHLVTSAGGRHRFATEPAPDLPSEVVLAAILDYMVMSGSTAKTVSLGRLATDPGSPAKAFRLNEEHLAEKLSAIARRRGSGVSLTSPAGAVQLGWRGDTSELAHATLCALFDASPDRSAVAGPTARDANLDPLLEPELAEHARGVVL
jgi:hypothetical protein